MGMDGRQQVGPRQGLDQKTVKPGQPARLTILAKGVGGQGDDRTVWQTQRAFVGADVARGLQAVLDRHRHIHQDQAGRLVLIQRHRLFAIHGLDQPIHKALQHLADNHHVGAVVLGHHHFQAGPQAGQRPPFHHSDRRRTGSRKRQFGAQGKDRPLADLRTHRDAAPHLFGQHRADRQAKAGPAELPPDAVVGLTETFEDRVDPVLRDADAGVGHRDLDQIRAG